MCRRLRSIAARALRRAPSLEIHVPISPTPTFLHMVHCLTLSLRKFGGAYREAPVILTVGDHTIDPGLTARHPWLNRLGVEVRWVSEEAFRTHSYFATGTGRFDHTYRSDVVLFLDADILIAAPFDELIRDVHDHQHLAGMIAQASPLQGSTTWQDLYDACGVARPAELIYEHVGFPYYRGGEHYRYCPPYFNYGVICAPASVLKAIGEPYRADVVKLLALTKNDLSAQIALTTSIIKLGLPWRALPARYNFPNHPAIEALQGEELTHVKFLHLKDRHQIHKNQVFADLVSLRATIRRTDLRGANEIARQVLEAIETELVEDLTDPKDKARLRVA